MSRFLPCLVLLLGQCVPARAHELPDKEIERRVQVTVKPDRILVQYSLAMNEATLKKELAQLGTRHAETLPEMWKQYETLILPELSRHMRLTVDGESVPFSPLRADYSGWSHRHLSCLLRADVQLTRNPKKIVVADDNFPDAHGNYRIAMKGLSGAKAHNLTVPPLVSRVKPFDWETLTGSQKKAIAQAEGDFSIADSSTAEFPRELVRFVPDPKKNPLFTGTAADTWDHKIRERGCILRHGGKWHLWYTGYNGERAAKKLLGYATSEDGLNWKRHPANPIFDQSWTEDVHVVHHDGQFYLVAEGRGDIPHMMTSPDGIQWTDHGRIDIRMRDGSPLPPGPYGTPTLWMEGETFYLFYERGDRGVWLSKSTDAKTWINVRDAPVIARGPAEYDRHAVALNQVIRHGDRYYGVYHANADPNWEGPWTTCLAVSEDLVTWKKYPGNPIVRTDDSSGQLIHDGRQYRLYTAHPDVRVYFSDGIDSE